MTIEASDGARDVLVTVERAVCTGPSGVTTTRVAVTIAHHTFSGCGRMLLSGTFRGTISWPGRFADGGVVSVRIVRVAAPTKSPAVLAVSTAPVTVQWRVPFRTRIRSPTHLRQRSLRHRSLPYCRFAHGLHSRPRFRAHVGALRRRQVVPGDIHASNANALSSRRYLSVPFARLEHVDVRDEGAHVLLRLGTGARQERDGAGERHDVGGDHVETERRDSSGSLSSAARRRSSSRDRGGTRRPPDRRPPHQIARARVQTTKRPSSLTSAPKLSSLPSSPSLLRLTRRSRSPAIEDERVGEEPVTVVAQERHVVRFEAEKRPVARDRRHKTLAGKGVGRPPRRDASVRAAPAVADGESHRA